DTATIYANEIGVGEAVRTGPIPLIHWPLPMKRKYVDSWRALIRMKQDGIARSIGVSNFTAAHTERLIAETGVVPAVNQIELHPRLQQRRLREFHARH